MTNRHCKICKSPVSGRADKIFCSANCKNFYHINLRSVTKKKAQGIDRHLHRNRSILLEIIGKSGRHAIIPRILLAEKKFQFSYHTHFYIDEHGNIVRFVYDFAWIESTNDEVAVFRTDFSLALVA